MVDLYDKKFNFSEIFIRGVQLTLTLMSAHMGVSVFTLLSVCDISVIMASA
jgi:hypothetical protein